jgi:hypothetical protein
VPQILEHREDAAVIGRRPRKLELREDARDVLLDGADREDELGRDAAVRPV